MMAVFLCSYSALLIKIKIPQGGGKHRLCENSSCDFDQIY
jgi:hypothetical protein